MKVLNLYSGIGGNRKLWTNVEVTAVEINSKIAKIYKDFFPEDKVIITEAHKYLLKHFDEYDFIWSSPPCPSHSKIRKATRQQNPPIYPDMKLYEEILLLDGYFNGKWIVENVISWYDPLIKPQIYKHHYYWANFTIKGSKRMDRGHNKGIEILSKIKGFNLNPYTNINKTKILRNCVEPESGLYIFNCAFKNKQKKLNLGEQIIVKN